MKRSALLALNAVLLLPMAAAAQDFTASLTPEAVTPDPGPAGASGFTVVTFSCTTVSYQVIVSGLDGITAAHIHEGAAGHTEPTATVTIPAGAELVLDDLVATRFGVTDGKGAMVVRSDRDLTGLARVHNDQTAAGDGTFGQLVRGLPMAAATSSGLLPFLSNQAAASGAGYRANIGWFNPSASPVTVTLTGYDDDGTMLGQVDHTAAGWAMEQVNVATLWPALADYGDFYVTYETAGDAPLFMYASVVDNVNGDAIYVAASPAL